MPVHLVTSAQGREGPQGPGAHTDKQGPTNPALKHTTQTQIEAKQVPKANWQAGTKSQQSLDS